MKKMLGVMFLITILLFPINAMAFNYNSNTSIINSEADKDYKNANAYNRYLQLGNYCISFLSQYGYKGNLSEANELYNFNDEIVALLFFLDTNGYIIIDLNDFSIPEFSLVSNCYYTNDTYKKYYNGALNYYKEENNDFINLSTNEIIDQNDISTLIENNAIYGEYSQFKSMPPTDNTIYAASSFGRTTGTLPNYSYNPVGICGSTAAAMFLRYYDIYVNGSIVPTNLQSSTGVSLINYLSPYIDKTNPGSNVSDVVNGIYTYLDDIGENMSINWDYSAITYAVTCVTNNRPYIAGFVSGSDLGAHWATGYGYSITSSGEYYIINDGHGNREVYININQSDFIIWSND